MASIESYRDLLAWQKAVELADECDRVADALPRGRAKLAAQIRDAANTVHACIAEGNGRPSRPDYLYFLNTAHASLQEVESHVVYAERRLLRRGVAKRAVHLIIITGKLLTALIASLEDR